MEVKTKVNPRCPRGLAILAHMSVYILIFFGYLRDLMRYLGIEDTKFKEKNREGYPALYRTFENFYIRNIYKRFCDGWNIPIRSVPGPMIDVVDRYSNDYNVTFNMPGTSTKAINMGSYNYLGFAENTGSRVDKVAKEIKKYGSSTLSTRLEVGTTETLLELEEKLAKFLGVEATIVTGMGFATNSNNIPALAGGPGTLILSDALNHTSLALGCKISGSKVKVFKHNDTVDLEKKLRSAIIEGRPNTDSTTTTGDKPSYKPWLKIIIIVEGIFSMEGTIVNLPEVIRIKKKYKAYLYLDEAHSVGALGKGIVFYHNCNPRDVDVMMGTFTKSFGAAGGYIAGNRSIIKYLKVRSHSSFYTTSMAPPIARQIISVIDCIMDTQPTSEGLKRLVALRSNTQYFRSELKKKGFLVYGDDNSPVVPLIVYNNSTVIEYIRAALKRKVAIVGAGYPATPLLEARVRFCLSASHTKEMLDEVLEVIDDIGESLHVKFVRDYNIIY